MYSRKDIVQLGYHKTDLRDDPLLGYHKTTTPPEGQGNTAKGVGICRVRDPYCHKDGAHSPDEANETYWPTFLGSYGHRLPPKQPALQAIFCTVQYHLTSQGYSTFWVALNTTE